MDATSQKTYGIDKSTVGAVVNSVIPGSVADRLGLKIGDVVTEVDGSKITSAADLAAAIGKISRGESKQVKFVRFENGARTQYDRQASF